MSKEQSLTYHLDVHLRSILMHVSALFRCTSEYHLDAHLNDRSKSLISELHKVIWGIG